jgi:hypothetical protein
MPSKLSSKLPLRGEGDSTSTPTPTRPGDPVIIEWPEEEIGPPLIPEDDHWREPKDLRFPSRSRLFDR